MKSKIKTKTKSNTIKGQNSKSKISPFTTRLLLPILLATIFLMLIGIGHYIDFLTYNFFSLLLGLLVESYFIYKDSNSILKQFFISTLVSLIIFLPFIGGGNEYNLESRLQACPYIFLISFIGGIALSKPDKVTKRQTEGTTLLQSLALIYWFVDSNHFTNTNLINILILGLIGVATFFSLINAFTKITLNEINRLILSVWSCIILISFSIDNFILLLSNSDINRQNNLLFNFKLGIQYFFVGVSSVYVMQNILMILAFFPQEKIDYVETFSNAKKMHLDRYSNLQVSQIDSFMCILFCGLVFLLNYFYQVFPTSTTIWIVIITFPLFLKLIKTKKENNYS